MVFAVFIIDPCGERMDADFGVTTDETVAINYILSSREFLETHPIWDMVVRPMPLREF
jgi:hypothetical protein